MKRYLLLALLAGTAHAQVQLSWLDSNGTGMTWRIEKQSGSTWTQIGTATATTYTDPTTTPGDHCYRVKAVKGSKESNPSNTACKTIDLIPPVLRVVDNVAMSVKPDYESLSFVVSQEVGRVAVGTECDRTRAVGDGWYAVPREAVQWTGSNRPANVVARCG